MKRKKSDTLKDTVLNDMKIIIWKSYLLENVLIKYSKVLRIKLRLIYIYFYRNKAHKDHKSSVKNSLRSLKISKKKNDTGYIFTPLTIRNGLHIKFYVVKLLGTSKSIHNNGDMVDRAKRYVVSESVSDTYLIAEKFLKIAI